MSSPSQEKSESHLGRKSGSHRQKATKLSNEKKINDDEFMAAAIGDVEWLRQSVRGLRGDINYDKNGLAPLHIAAIHGRLECLRLLIEKLKVDVNLPSTTGWRPIHLCVSNQTGKRSFQCLEYLLSQGGDPSIANEDGITPMHQAASEGHVQCLKALIEAGGLVAEVDQRGHKPIDLAKLWGHRKCARILAAEGWHQDKDFLSKEMKHLQKIKMQQVLLEIELDEEHKSEQQFYGNMAFKEWLDARDLKPGSTGPGQKSRVKSPSEKGSQMSKSSKVKRPGKERSNAAKVKDQDKEGSKGKGQDNIRPAPMKESLQMANSVQPEPRSGGAEIQRRPLAAGRRHQTQLAKHRPSPIPERSPSQSQTEEKPVQPSRFPLRNTEIVTRKGLSRDVQRHTPESDKRDDSPNPEEEIELEQEQGFYNEKEWVKSLKLPVKKYITILEDHYPRDEYTMLPKDPPKRVSREPTQIDAKDMPRLPKDLILRTMHPEDFDRPVVYKCKHIGDVHKKQHFDQEYLPKPEAAVHLTNDINSRLFQSALLQRAPPTTTKTSVSSWSAGSAPFRHNNLPGLVGIMQRMQQPNHFPNMRGQEYDLNLGQYACI